MTTAQAQKYRNSFARSDAYTAYMNETCTGPRTARSKKGHINVIKPINLRQWLRALSQHKNKTYSTNVKEFKGSDLYKRITAQAQL